MTRPSAREIGDELSVRRVVLKISCSRECLQRERNIFQHSHCRSDRIGLSGRLVDSELLVLLLLESSIGLISTLPAEPPFQLGDSKASQMIPEEVLPGAGFNFQDVTKIFTDAASEMEPGSFVFMDDLTLHDAMGAFEIGEPRLDSGLVIEGEYRPSFDPTMPLLPEELCWILDRAFSYEMEWHAGNLLSHTVFTLLYTHHLADLDPEFIPSHLLANYGPLRPPELTSVVLRAWVMGLLKCCDLSWRELSKAGVQDLEDWQGEKCDVSLLEGVPVKHVVSALEQAGMWLLTTTKIPIIWRGALCARMILRKTILQLMAGEVFSNPTQFQGFIDVAREQLGTIRAHPSSEPGPSSPAHLAFDPSISRHLKTFVPLRVIPVPAQEETWTAIDALLDGWQELSVLSRTNTLLTWELVGNLRVWLPKPPPRIPYIRSSIQSIFYDGLLILNKYTFVWMVDRFFSEMLGVTYDTVVQNIKQHLGSNITPIPRMERILYKARPLWCHLITPHIRGHWLNAPRRRRHLVKSLLDWHILYDVLVEITTEIGKTDLPKDDVAFQLPNVALVWRLSAIREVIFSGFQLNLFAVEERPMAYWYATQVLEAHLNSLDSLLNVVRPGSTAYQELQFQHQLFTALQAMSTATFVVSMSHITFDWNRMRPTFYRRYKWAFLPDYDNIRTPVVGHPELYRLVTVCSDVLQDEMFSPSGSIEVAETILSGLLLSGSTGGWAGSWANDRLQFLQSLIEGCKRLHGLPASILELDDFDVARLKWDSQVQSWFPTVKVKAGD